MSTKALQDGIRETKEYKSNSRFVNSDITRRLSTKGFNCDHVADALSDMCADGELVRRDGGFLRRTSSGKWLSKKWDKSLIEEVEESDV
jgi:hypothetical protein